MGILKDGSILLNDWSRGESPSYLGDLKNIQNVDAISVPGIIFANQKMQTMGVELSSYTGRTFTADASTDIITVALAVFITGQAVRLTTTGTLPAGLSLNTTYYVTAVSGSTMKLASTLANALAGTGINITDAGTGTHTMTGSVMGRVKKVVQNPAATTSNYRYFAIDETGRVWVQFQNIWSWLPGNATGSGQGIEVWKGYLFAIGDAGVISTYGPLADVGNTAAWTATWKTATGADTFTCPTIAGSDDILYIGQGRYVSKVEEDVAPFVPGTAASYIWTDTALTLPTGYRIRCMVENGVELAIGTWIGTSGLATIFAAALEVKKADLFFWDRSDTTFRIPVHIEENGVNSLISINNFVYAMCGHEGRMYVTNGTSAELFATIPQSVFDRQQDVDHHLFFFPNAIAYHKGRILVGVSSGDTISTATISPLGIYAIDPKSASVMMEQNVASGNTGTSGSVGIGAIVSVSEQDLVVGIYYDGSLTFPGGINRVIASTTRYGTSALIESGLYSVGSAKEKSTFNVIEFSFGKTLSSESVRLSYRKTTTGAYTTVCTINSSTVVSDGSTTKYQVETSLLSDLTDVQFKVELLCADSLSSPELIYVHIKKGY